MKGQFWKHSNRNGWICITVILTSTVNIHTLIFDQQSNPTLNDLRKIEKKRRWVNSNPTLPLFDDSSGRVWRKKIDFEINVDNCAAQSNFLHFFLSNLWGSDRIAICVKADFSRNHSKNFYSNRSFAKAFFVYSECSLRVGCFCQAASFVQTFSWIRETMLLIVSAAKSKRSK